MSGNTCQVLVAIQYQYQYPVNNIIAALQLCTYKRSKAVLGAQSANNVYDFDGFNNNKTYVVICTNQVQVFQFISRF